MELRHLRYFVAVAEEQNVTRAAVRLHVSQPPLTRQIQDLEEELGVLLFQRNGRSIRLTEAGRFFLAEARAALHRVEQAARAVRAFATEGDSELHVGYAPTPAAEILPRLLREFRRTSPRVRVILHDLSSPEMLAGLRDGRLHAAIMMRPPSTATRGIRFTNLLEYPIVVAIGPHHRLARKRSVTLSEILGEPIIAYARKDYPDYHALLARVFGSQAKHLHITEECDSGPTLIAAVASGKGVAIVPKALKAASGRRLKFVPLSPAPQAAVVGIGLCSRNDPTTHTLLEAALSVVVENP